MTRKILYAHFFLFFFLFSASLIFHLFSCVDNSLRTTLCVRFKSEVVACGVVYVAARRFQVPLPENPPWWKEFDVDWNGIEEVRKTLAHLYTLPKAQYIPVCKEGGSFRTSNRTWDSPSQAAQKDVLSSGPTTNDENTRESCKDALLKAALDKLKESKKSGDESKSIPAVPISEHRVESAGERKKDKDRERERSKDRVKSRDCERGRESDRKREREDAEKIKDRGRSRDKGSGHVDKSKHHSSRDRDYHSSYSSKEDRRRHRHH